MIEALSICTYNISLQLQGLMIAARRASPSSYSSASSRTPESSTGLSSAWYRSPRSCHHQSFARNPPLPPLSSSYGQGTPPVHLRASQCPNQTRNCRENQHRRT